MRFPFFHGRNTWSAILVGLVFCLTVFGVYRAVRERSSPAAAHRAEQPGALSPTPAPADGTGGVPAPGDMPPGTTPYDPGRDNRDGFWETADPADSMASGLNGRAVGAYLDLCRLTGADAALVVHRGKIAGEWYSSRYTGTQYAMSSTKSITGLLAGMMQDRGYLSIDDPVGKYIPGWSSGRRGRVTIRHLLTQTGGFRTRSAAGQSVGFTAEKNSFVMAMTPDYEPGTRWAYSNEGVQLLSPVLEAACGGQVEEFAERELFLPLGMAATRLQVSGRNGDAWTYADMRTSARDLARIGILVLQDGSFRGRRIISQDYLKEAFTPIPLAPNYGLLWWLSPGPEVVISARGYLSTDLYVLPAYELIVVRMQAPRAGYTGEDESAPYSRYAQPFLAMMIGKADPEAAEGLLREAAARRNGAPAAGTLEEAIAFSAKGETTRVLELLLPLVAGDTLDTVSRAKACSTIALQYIRTGEQARAGEYLDRAEAYGVETLGGYWTTNYREMRNMVRRR